VAQGQHEQQEPAREPVWRTVETAREPEALQVDKRELKDILDIMRDSRHLQQDQDASAAQNAAERSSIGRVEGEGIEGMVRQSPAVIRVSRALAHPPALPLAVPYGSAYTYAAPLPLYVPAAYQERGGGGGVGAGGDEALTQAYYRLSRALLEPTRALVEAY